MLDVQDVLADAQGVRAEVRAGAVALAWPPAAKGDAVRPARHRVGHHVVRPELFGVGGPHAHLLGGGPFLPLGQGLADEFGLAEALDGHAFRRGRGQAQRHLLLEHERKSRPHVLAGVPAGRAMPRQLVPRGRVKRDGRHGPRQRQRKRLVGQLHVLIEIDRALAAELDEPGAFGPHQGTHARG
jgi:hypothetical protein